jgi:hypothetical protein
MEEKSMVRLILMPLVDDFGELLNHPLGTIRPKINLVFTRDCRIFGQFQHFPALAECEGDFPQKASIRSQPLPAEMMLVEYGEEGETETRFDGLGVEIRFVYTKQLKALTIPKDSTDINKAIKAFIETLPDDMPVILAWE